MRRMLPALCMVAALIGSAVAAEPVSYTILSSESTASDADWRLVIETLAAKHPGATKLTYPDGEPAKVLASLREHHPRFACFVATPEEATRAMVTQVHQLTRRIDDDPYADVLWGILTGHDAANALDIARTKNPLVIERVASGTDVQLDACREGIWFCELEKHRMVRKKPGGEPLQAKGPADTTRALADTLTNYKAQLFVTSGHATERGWQIGFRYRNGTFQSKEGQLSGKDTEGKTFDIVSPNPKVYMPIGNCLMGHIDGADAMALAWLKSAGVRQMLGYTVPTWYGYAGWGCLDYFVEQPGRYNFTEAVFANQAALIHRIETCFPELVREPLTNPHDAQKLRSKVVVSEAAKALGLSSQDAIGLLFDRDALAFYGDPAWDARLAAGPLAYDQSLTEHDGLYTLTIKPRLGAQSFDTINSNGSQRGGRPFVAWLPKRIKDPVLVSGAELHPVITDDFILVPHPGTCDPDQNYRITFKGEAPKTASPARPR